MTRLIDSIGDIATKFDAIVLDQWGVLHDGSAPYPSALTALDVLRDSAAKIGVLSNSGKRAGLNVERIAAMGFDTDTLDCVMTSGEALWLQFASGGAQQTTLYPIEARPGDAAFWAQGLPITLVDTPQDAEAILLMGLPDGSEPDAYGAQLQTAFDRALPLYCSNPDFVSPRGGGTYVMSPGALAQRYREVGGEVQLFGKPYPSIFQAIETTLNCTPDRILMIGDSLHHDILGAQTAGWHSLLIQAGIHAPDIRAGHQADDIAQLANAAAMPPPDYSLPDLR